MDFLQKYQLVELLPGEGVQSYRARQAGAGRDVTVHLLAGGKTPENEALLARLRGMQPHSMAKLIEVGEHEGATFIVTVAPPFQRLDDWLAEQDRAAAAAKDFGKAGIWKRPDAISLAPPVFSQPVPAPVRTPEPGEFTKQFQRPPAPAEEPGLPASPPVASSEPGEFTRMFQNPMTPPSAATTQFTPPPPPPAAPSREPGEFTKMFKSPVAPSPLEPPAPSAATTQLTPPPPPPTATSGEPGEFTKMFKSPVVPAAPEPPPPAIRATTAPSVASPAAPSAEPGEFTRLFQAPPAPPTPEPLRAPPPPAAGPGEFTRLFNSSMPDVAAPGDWPQPAAKPQEPGEFTRMFQAPAAPQVQTPPPVQGGEFTDFFKPSPGAMPAGPQFPAVSQFPQTAPAPAPAPPAREVGDYTRMFGSGTLSGAPGPAPAGPPPPPAPPASYPSGGGATQAFRTPPAYAPAAAPQGPSEYTRMISVPSNFGAPTPPAAQMPGTPQMGVPQMPAMPQVPQVPQMPQMPQMQQPVMPQITPPVAVLPPVPAPSNKSSNLLLIAIFCLLAFLLGGVAVYLMVRPK